MVKKAFERYFRPDNPLVPDVEATHPSPIQYGYRTKLTPHFDIPGSRSKNSSPQAPKEIGFLQKGRRTVLDIEGAGDPGLGSR